MSSVTRPANGTVAAGSTLPAATARRHLAVPGQRDRVAVITPWHPEPVDNGSKQRIRQLIVALADRYEIVLISLLAPDQREVGPADIVPEVWQQHVLPLPAYRPGSARALFGALGSMPRSFAATWNPGVADAVNRIITRTRVRLAIGADLRVLHYLMAVPPAIHAVVDEVNTSPFLAGPGEALGLARLRAVSRQRKYARLLRGAARRLDAAIVASPEEARAYRELSGSSRVVLIGNAAAALPDRPWLAPPGARVIYAGSLTYGPNAEAVAYFTRSILPLIQRDVADVGLTVTGTLPAVVPPGADHPRVSLTGRLDAAGLDAAYRASRACVVPLLSGTGTRIKVLEAMALGIPVVSTTKGVEGLALAPGDEYLRADTPAEFAAATALLLRDASYATALGARGRERVRRDYTWESRGQQLNDLVRECLAGATRRTP